MSTQFLRPRTARGTAAVVAAPLLILVLAVASTVFLAEAGYEAIDVHLAYNLCTRPHRELFDALRRTLCDNPPILEFEGHRYLSIKDAEDGTPPARTIKLHLAGCSDEDRVTLALSDADGAGLWHAFPGFEPFFPNSTTLPFNASYDHLIGGHQNLPAVPLGRASALEAIRARPRSPAPRQRRWSG